MAAAHLETIKGRPRRKKVEAAPVVPVTVPEPMDSVTNAAESVTDHTLAVTAEVDVVKTQPEAAPQPASTTALDELVAELQEIRVGLRQPDLTNTERATLRLRAEACCAAHRRDREAIPCAEACGGGQLALSLSGQGTVSRGSSDAPSTRVAASLLARPLPLLGPFRAVCRSC